MCANLSEVLGVDGIDVVGGTPYVGTARAVKYRVKEYNNPTMYMCNNYAFTYSTEIFSR